GKPGDPSELDVFGRRCRGERLVQQPRLRLGQMPLGDTLHDNLLALPEAARDLDFVGCSDLSIWLRCLPVHIHLAAPAGLLRLGARLEQTGDVEPHVKTHGSDFMRWVAGLETRPTPDAAR